MLMRRLLVDADAARLGARRRFLAALAAALVLAVLPGLAASPAAAAPPPIGTITGHAPFEDNGIDGPVSAVLGPDGAMWFSNRDNSSIGRVTTAGEVSNLRGNGIAFPGEMVLGADGALWFTNGGERSIGRITTAGAVSTYTIPSGASHLTAGVDGAIWFTSRTSAAINRLTGGGAITTFTDPNVAHPTVITSAADGTLWIGDGGKVHRMTTVGAFTTFDVAQVGPPSPSGITNEVQGITTGPDGTVYFTTHGSAYDWVGKLRHDGRIGLIPVGGVPELVWARDDAKPTEIVAAGGTLQFVDELGFGLFRLDLEQGFGFAGVLPAGEYSLAAGPEGLWLTDALGDTISRLPDQPELPDEPQLVTVARQVRTVAGAIAPAPDGSLWFTTGPTTIARQTPAGAVIEHATPNPLPPAPSLAVTGDGTVWFAGVVPPEMTPVGERPRRATIDRIAPDGTTATFDLGPAYAAPRVALTTGPDGAVWFTVHWSEDPADNFLGRIAADGLILRFTDPGLDRPGGITTGRDGALWFTTESKVGRIGLDGVITYRNSLLTNSATHITVGPDGALWYVNQPASALMSIGRYERAFNSDWHKNFPSGIAATVTDLETGPDGLLWFTLADGRIGSMDTTGQFTFRTLAGAHPGGIAAGPDGGVWFSQHQTPSVAGTAHQLGRMQVLAAGARPSAPRVFATGGDGRIDTTWIVGDGGSPLTSVTVTLSPGGATCTWTGGPSTCAFTGLPNGTTYTVSARATNLYGTGPPPLLTATAAPHRPVPTPAFPTAANASNFCAVISWWAPPGDPVVESIITLSSPGRADKSFTFPGDQRAPQICQDSGYGLPATFRIRLRTAHATGPPSASTQAVDMSAPQTPVQVTATPGQGSALVRWSGGSVPAPDGSIITPYRNGVAQAPITFPNKATSQLVTELTDGATYTFTVVAYDHRPSSVLRSTPSRPSKPIEVGHAAAPAFPLAQTGNGQARVSWWPAAVPTTGAVITPYLDGVAQPATSFLGAGSVQTVTGLTNGQTYTFTIALLDANGVGPASAMTAPVLIGTPSAPGFPSATAGPGEATVRWWTPAANGSPISAVHITAWRDGVAEPAVVVPGNPAQATVGGLVPGASYRFTIAATNAVGTGPTSAATTAVVPT